MNWTTAVDLRAQAMRLWERGLLLSAAAGQGQPFPWRLQLKCPGSSEIAGHFDQVRQWAAALLGTAHVRIEVRSFNHRVFGANSLPCEAWLDSVDDALALVGKRAAAARFRGMLERTERSNPALLSWLLRKPLRALELDDMWPQLLAVAEWLVQHPLPGIYLRQADVPGVHTKFIEANRGVLSELLDLCLPPHAILSQYTGVAGFARRYGFLDKPLRVRFRLLDPLLEVIPGHSTADTSVDAATFAALSVPVRRVFITENETNFLAFPPAPDSMVVFGAGYGWETLADAQWLRDVQLWYWGDIDTHGFAILDQLRARHPHVVSFLMDRETLVSHRHAWTAESSPLGHDLPSLTPAERAVYDLLRQNTLGRHLRLEQELVGFTQLTAAIAETPDRQPGPPLLHIPPTS